MRKFNIGISIILSGLLLILTGCSSSSTAPASSVSSDPVKAKVLKLGHNNDAVSPSGKAAVKFAELVKQKSGGKLTVDVFPKNQLGGNQQMVEQTVMGSLDMTMQGLGGLGYLDDAANFMQLPFVFQSQEHAHKVVEGEIGKELSQNLATKGIVLLSQSWDRLPREFVGNKPIMAPADLKGYKIRGGFPSVIEAFKVLGASPTNVALNEMYTALQQGVLQAVELPLDYIYDYSIYEVSKYLDMNNHTYGTQFIAINKKTYDSLSKDQQKVLMDVAKEAGDENNKLVWASRDDYMNKLKGTKLIIETPDREAFVKALADKVPDLEKTWPSTKGLYARIQAANK